MIRGGRTATGKRCPGVPGKRGWDRLIVNDNHTPTLATHAWAHAKRLALLDDKVPAQRVRQAAAGRRSALTGKDLNFVRRVRKQDPQSFAILRFEVTAQTSRFAGVTVPRQCSLLTQWASLQGPQNYTLIYPIFVHGVRGQTTFYDSFRQGTFGLQRALMDRYPGGPPADAGGGCDPGAGPPAPPPAPISPPVPAVPQAHAVKPPDVKAQEPTAVTCDSARLHGWVNPHGTASTFHFEYWKRGGNDAQVAGSGDAGAGRDRVDVSPLAGGLQPDTGYSAKLIAVNAAGRSVSDVVSFTTRRRCP